MSVTRRGTDSSGRAIYASDDMWAWWGGVLERLDFAASVVITQGSWMSKVPGGGAAGSAGWHDLGGAFDCRVWNLTDAQVARLVATVRAGGGAAWLRNVTHGGFTDPHVHLIYPRDSSGVSSGVRFQWAEYVAGRDGLSSRGPDYHPRPSPLVTTTPEDWTMPTAEQIAEAVWKRQIKTIPGDMVPAAQVLAQTHNRADDARKNLAGLPKRISDRLKKDLAGTGADPAAIEAAVRSVFREAFGEDADK